MNEVKKNIITIETFAKLKLLNEILLLFYEDYIYIYAFISKVANSLL